MKQNFLGQKVENQTKLPIDTEFCPIQYPFADSSLMDCISCCKCEAGQWQMDKCIECDGFPASNAKGVEAMMAVDGTIDTSKFKKPLQNGLNVI